MDLVRTIYSRDLKIAAMRAQDAGSTAGEIPDIPTESETAGTLARRLARRNQPFPALAGAPICRRSTIRAGSPSWNAKTASSRWRISPKSVTAFQGSSLAGRRQWRGCLFAEIEQNRGEKGKS
jgi:hypothetical protein